MGQLGFFDADRRLSALSERGDPLEAMRILIAETSCGESSHNATRRRTGGGTRCRCGKPARRNHWTKTRYRDSPESS